MFFTASLLYEYTSLNLPEELGGRFVFRWQQSPGAQDVLQELDGQVFQVVIPVKILKKNKNVTLVLGHEDENVKRAQSVKVSLSCHLSVLGDPVPQDGKHPHGRRRTRDGHLPPCRLPK